LQKVLTVSKDKKVDVAEVEKVTGAPRSELIRKLLRAITEKDVSASLKEIKTAIEDNIDIRVLTRLLIHRMRVVLLLRHAPDLAASFSKELTEADLELARELSKHAGATSEALKALLDAHATMAYAAVPHLPLEMAVMDICKK
jgi:DNA polymerase III gamma/tau subunit